MRLCVRTGTRYDYRQNGWNECDLIYVCRSRNRNVKGGSRTGLMGATADAVFVFANSLLCGILYFAAYKMVWGDLRFVTAFIKTILPKALYSAAAAFVLFIPMRKSFGLIKVKRLF